MIRLPCTYSFIGASLITAIFSMLIVLIHFVLNQMDSHHQSGNILHYYCSLTNCAWTVCESNPLNIVFNHRKYIPQKFNIQKNQENTNQYDYKLRTSQEQIAKLNTTDSTHIILISLMSTPNNIIIAIHFFFFAASFPSLIFNLIVGCPVEMTSTSSSPSSAAMSMLRSPSSFKSSSSPCFFLCLCFLCFLCFLPGESAMK